MNQKRQPKGTTVGGQFAASKNPESNLDLSDGSYSETDKRGNTFHYNSAGQFHRDGGLPAIEWADGMKEYWVNGQLHRDGCLPAAEWADGMKEYWVNGQRHRDGGLPAIEFADGTKEYWVNGHLHRDGGLPAIERADGTKEYYVNDRRHNAHGPAVITARGTRQYWLEGRRVLKAEWESHPDVIAAKKSGDSVDELPSE